jgi:hypothetical protein
VSKPLGELRALLNRTSALVSSGGLRRLLPQVDSEGSESFRAGAADRLARMRALIPIERLAALKTLATERAIVAASIEGSTLRLLSYSNNRVAGWTTVPLTDRSGRAGQISDPVSLGSAIDEAFEQFQLSRRRVCWGLPGYQSTARIIEVPNVRAEELPAAIEEEFERLVGTSASDFYLSWQRLPGRIRQRRVFVLAVPRTVVESALEALDVANIRPYTMDLRPLAIARAIGRADAIVANLEEGSLDLVIVERNVPTLIRSLPLLGSSAGREAAQNRLVDETERTLSYYDDANPDHPLDIDTPLYLTGSLATGIALAERLRGATRHPMGRLSSPIPAPPEFPTVEYLVNLGLALKQS